MSKLDFLTDFTEYTQISYDKELNWLMFMLYSKRQKQVVNIRIECEEKQVTKKFVKENLKKLQDMIETDITK